MTGTTYTFFFADSKYNLHRKVNTIQNWDSVYNAVDSYSLRHAIVHIQYDLSQGTFTASANFHRPPIVAFNAGLIGKKSVDVELTFTADNSLPDPDHKKTSFDFKLTINRNDRPGFYPNKAYDRSVLTFNLSDYAYFPGGFNSIQVSGKEAGSVSITNQIS